MEQGGGSGTRSRIRNINGMIGSYYCFYCYSFFMIFIIASEVTHFPEVEYLRVRWGPKSLSKLLAAPAVATSSRLEGPDFRP